MQPGMSGWQAMRSYRRDPNVKELKLAPGTRRRILGFARPYTWPIVVFLSLVVFDAFLTVSSPLLLKQIVDKGVTPGDRGVVIGLALVVAGLAVVDHDRWAGATVPVLPDRRGADLRPPDAGVRARPAAAGGVSSPAPRPEPSSPG